MERFRTVTVDAARLTDAPRRSRRFAAAIERHADGASTDPDTLVATLRGNIAEFAFDLEAATHLP
jgi:hypothetical protein